MNSEIIWYHNTKQLLYKDFDYDNFNHLFKSINSFYQNVFPVTSRLWYNFKYINSILNLYFINFSKFKNPLPIFYALIFKHISTETLRLKVSSVEFFNMFYKQDRLYPLGNIKSHVIFYLTNEYFINNDIGVVESDFNLFTDILIINSPIKISSNIFSGVYFGFDDGLSFKFKR